MCDSLFDRLAKQAGFDTFQKWVEYEHTRRRIEENEYRVKAMRLMFGDKAAQQMKQDLEKEGER